MSTSERESNDLLRVREAADELRVNDVTIRRAVHAGELPAFTLGEHGRYRIRRLDLEDYLQPVEPRT